MIIDRLRISGGVVASSSGTQTLLLLDMTPGTRNFTVPSGYTSFKVELVGGSGLSGVLAGSDGIGVRVTFIMPVSDMSTGNSYTVGNMGYATSDYGGTDGTSTIFKGMTAGGGTAGGYNYNGANGTASGTAYTNTTPNQWASPASIKIWGIT